MMIDTLNGIEVPDYDFEHDKGYFRKNDLEVKENATDVTLKHLSNTTFEMNIRNFNLDFYSRDFKYAMIFIPMRGHCRVKMHGSSLVV
jgi:hypothetical protein